MTSNGYRTKAIRVKGEECELTGATENIVVHHIDGDRSNDELDNLLVVAEKVHNNIHSDSDEFQEWTDKLPHHLVSNNSRHPKTSITVRVQDGTLAALNAESERQNYSRSRLMRDYITEGLEHTKPGSELERELEVKEREIELLNERVEGLESILSGALKK